MDHSAEASVISDSASLAPVNTFREIVDLIPDFILYGEIPIPLRACVMCVMFMAGSDPV